MTSATCSGNSIEMNVRPPGTGVGVAFGKAPASFLAKLIGKHRSASPQTMRVDDTDHATGFFTTRSDSDAGMNARTADVLLRADPSELQVLDGGNDAERAELIAQRLQEWKSAANW